VSPRSLLASALAGAGLGLAAACAPRPVALPSGPAAPFQDFQYAYRQASESCRGVRTWSGEVALSGRSGRAKLRGRLLAGFAPGGLRLEGVAPFGPPAFVMVARDGDATLLLPRDRRILRHAAPGEVVEALAGVALGPDALRALVAGCVAPDGAPHDGRAYPDGWVAVDLGDGAAALLRQRDGRWRIDAGRLPGLTVEYRDFASGTPRWLRLRSDTADRPPVDLTLAASQVDINVPAPAAWFALDVPPDAVPLTLAELRQAGPLGQKN